VKQLIYTSTVATIAVDRPELPNELPTRNSKRWWALQAFEVDGGARGVAGRERSLPVIVAMPTRRWALDWKPTPTERLFWIF